MIRGKKVRLYPTPEQENLFWQFAGTARHIYNFTLNRQIENRKAGGKFISDGEIRKEITQLKKTDKYKWLKEISNNVPKQAVKDCCNAYKRFFNKQAKIPKFKSRKKSKPSFYNDSSKLKVEKNKVWLEKIGWIKIAENIIPISPYKYTNPRIIFDGKYWYISIGLKKDFEKIELSQEVIGIDLGIKMLAVCSNGMKSKNINKTKIVKKLEKRLRRLQRKISNKYEMNKNGKEYAKTSNIIKLEKQIRLLFRKLANIRLNHIHQETTKIVKIKPSKIVMETLNIKGMMKNKYLAKAVQNQCLYEFKRQIKYKCENYRIEFVEANRWFASSKICSKCKNKKPILSLSERIYKCEECGLEIDRDLNASINLSNYKVS
ncbi:transposase [Candidatus Epulonipiscium fishelsonii]|uniref:Transposase n=1 Tax=Candidatus Epulonipiscium fishelsonii TaxID=77094 RepID=A0ACC8X8J6_9FIRM|nr:transposase [Epulopiscium sp. SCG-B11WGA-EpuloA1]ONI38401.1 transposase [Epulopiscium sp. SCG-B05WGA-EpuloA1]